MKAQKIKTRIAFPGKIQGKEMDYLSRVQKAVDYIDEHIKEELRTEAIAKVAAFSMWYFQRIFRSAVGEPLKEYVGKRRLTHALLELTSTDRRILDIAIDYRFESQGSFTRAFKNVFGVNPGECRRQGAAERANLLPFLSGKPKITLEYLDHLQRGTTMQPKIVDMPEIKFVGMGARFISILSPERDNFVVIPKLWQEYMRRAHEISTRVGPIDLGVCEMPDDGDRKHPEELNYLAGTEVRSFDDVPEGMEMRTIPGGRYAVFTHRGRLDRLGHTMNYIFGSWLAHSGEELRGAPQLELYDKRFNAASEQSEMDIYIPLK